METPTNDKHLYFVSTLDITSLDVMVAICPNPTYNQVSVMILPMSYETYTYELCNDKGNIILVKGFETQEETIEMIKFKGDSFLLKVFNDKQLLKSFKIQKVN